MVVAAGRDEGRLVADSLHQVEAQDVAGEGERAVDVGDLQVDVPDVDSRIEAHGADDSWADGTPGVCGSGSFWNGSRSRRPAVLRAPRSGTVERCEREDSEREQQG